MPTLIGASRRFLTALRDPIVGPPVAARLVPEEGKPPFDVSFEAQLGLVEGVDNDQSTTKGQVGTLTRVKSAAYTELERLIGAARRTASLAYPGNDVLLHAEFKVGITTPADLESELGRARIIHAACLAHAKDLAGKGWISADTTALAAAIATLSKTDEVKEATVDTQIGITTERNKAANDLYRSCQALQNAARLAYPSTELGKTPGIETARARYLIEEFPPRGSSGGGSTPDTPPAPPTPEPTK